MRQLFKNRKSSDLKASPQKIKSKIKNINRKQWTDSEDSMLNYYVNLFGTKWLEIAEKLGGRSASQCSQRWKRMKKNFQEDMGIIKKRWTSDEDQKLLILQQQHGSNWKEISKFIPNKDRRAVRNRYVNVLDPNLNLGQMTEEEDFLICQLYRQYGSQWTQISKHLPGRPENMIKNRFNSHLKQKYFQLPNLYYIKNSKMLRLQKKSEQQIVTIKTENNFDDYYQQSLEIDDYFNYNSQVMSINQDSCAFEGQESFQCFLREF